MNSEIPGFAIAWKIPRAPCANFSVDGEKNIMTLDVLYKNDECRQNTHTHVNLRKEMCTEQT